MRVISKVENNREERVLINFFKQLPFVKIRESQKYKKELKFEEIFGIWKNKDITKKIERESTENVEIICDTDINYKIFERQ